MAVEALVCKRTHSLVREHILGAVKARARRAASCGPRRWPDVRGWGDGEWGMGWGLGVGVEGGGGRSGVGIGSRRIAKKRGDCKKGFFGGWRLG